MALDIADIGAFTLARAGQFGKRLCPRVICFTIHTIFGRNRELRVI
jgi:hypothetical protein